MICVKKKGKTLFETLGRVITFESKLYKIQNRACPTIETDSRKRTDPTNGPKISYEF